MTLKYFQSLKKNLSKSGKRKKYFDQWKLINCLEKTKPTRTMQGE